jgi:hypothetical protein
MKRTVDIDDPERPHGSVNHRRTTPNGCANVLPKNLIVVPRARFTTATVQRSRSRFSSCTTRSRAGKLEAAQHHSRVVKRKGGRSEGREVFSCVAF